MANTIIRTFTEKDRENAKRLKALWEVRKKDLDLTQVKVADFFGCRDNSFVSQMLNAKVALNKQMILTWAEILKVDPERIDPDLSKIKIVETEFTVVEVPILIAIGTTRRTRKSIVVNTTGTKNQLYGIEINTTDYKKTAPKGSVAIIDPLADISPGTQVVIQKLTATRDEYILGELVSQDGVAVVLENLFNEDRTEHNAEEIVNIHKIHSIERP